jgi:hypothetical protein
LEFVLQSAQGERPCAICSFEGCLNIRSSDDIFSRATLTIVKAESITQMIEGCFERFIRRLLKDRKRF